MWMGAGGISNERGKSFEQFRIQSESFLNECELEPRG